MAEEFSFADKNILIIDDQRTFQVMLRSMLRSMGANAERITTVPTGEKAISACSKQSYHILFIDYNLGLGRNGRQLYAELKEEGLIPLNNISIIITGESLATMVVGALEVNPDDYIIKPFSQNLLKQRIARLWRLKQLLLPAYTHIKNQEPSLALKVLDELSEQKVKLTAHTWRLKCEILYQEKQFAVLDQFLNEILRKKKYSWAMIYKAKLLEQDGDLSKAIAFAKEALAHSHFNVEAYDVLTDCYLKFKDLDTAYQWVQTGIEKSPFSVTRQYKLSHVAKLKQDFDTSIKACQQVVTLTSKGKRKDIPHLLNYIRNIIDICDIVEDQAKRHRYSQEVIYAIAESKQHSGYFEGMTCEEFEDICLARLDSSNGHEFKAKKRFFQLINKYLEPDKALPSDMLVDSIALMLTIGEFDKADEFTNQLNDNEVELDEFSKRQLDDRKKHAAPKAASVTELNNLGIKAFEQRDFHKAYDLFDKALTIAPMNTGSAINQLQAVIELAKSEAINRWKYVDNGRQLLKIIADVPLSPAHEKRTSELIDALNKLESERKR